MSRLNDKLKGWTPLDDYFWHDPKLVKVDAEYGFAGILWYLQIITFLRGNNGQLPATDATYAYLARECSSIKDGYIIAEKMKQFVIDCNTKFIDHGSPLLWIDNGYIYSEPLNKRMERIFGRAIQDSAQKSANQWRRHHGDIPKPSNEFVDSIVELFQKVYQEYTHDTYVPYNKATEWDHTLTLIGYKMEEFKRHNSGTPSWDTLYEILAEFYTHALTHPDAWLRVNARPYQFLKERFYNRYNDLESPEQPRQDDISERTKHFKEQLESFTTEFTKKTVDDFFRYWSEPNKGKTKMRYEMEKTWDTHRRLITWQNNESKFNKNKNDNATPAADKKTFLEKFGA